MKRSSEKTRGRSDRVARNRFLTVGQLDQMLQNINVTHPLGELPPLRRWISLGPRWRLGQNAKHLHVLVDYNGVHAPGWMFSTPACITTKLAHHNNFFGHGSWRAMKRAGWRIAAVIVCEVRSP